VYEARWLQYTTHLFSFDFTGVQAFMSELWLRLFFVSAFIFAISVAFLDFMILTRTQEPLSSFQRGLILAISSFCRSHLSSFQGGKGRGRLGSKDDGRRMVRIETEGQPAFWLSSAPLVGAEGKFKEAERAQPRDSLLLINLLGDVVYILFVVTFSAL
jgi:hypothetical protein